jgi:tetratricopeptide (TPR) repeat protein
LGAYFVLRWHIIGGLAPIPIGLSHLPTQGVRALAALGRYAKMTVVPQPVAADVRLPPPAGPTDPYVLLGLAVVLLVVGGVAWLRRPQPALAMLLGWFALELVPASNVVPIYPGFEVYVVERALYPALVGWCLFLCVGAHAGRAAFPRLPERSRVLWLGVGGAAAATLLVVTVVKVAAWRDDVTLWRATLASNPASPDAHIALAAALAEQGRLDEAAEAILEAARRFPADPWGTYVRGWIAELQGKDREALRHYARSVALGKDDELVFSRSATLAARLHEWDLAGHFFASAAERFPRAAWPQVGLGWYEGRRGHPDVSRAHLERAVRLEPTAPSRPLFLGRLLAAEGRFAEAEQAFREALRLDPAFLPARQSLATLAEQEGHLAEAIQRWRQVEALLPAGRYRARIAARLQRLEAKIPPAPAGDGPPPGTLRAGRPAAGENP